MMTVAALALLISGGAVLVADSTFRVDGYITTSSEQLSSPGYAVVSSRIALNVGVDGLPALRLVLGDVRFRAASDKPRTPLFIGIGPAQAVDRYVHGVPYTTVQSIGQAGSSSTHHAGERLLGLPHRNGSGSRKPLGGHTSRERAVLRLAAR
jgi:hypothetical protein